jgi:Amt family ammonium transporter
MLKNVLKILPVMLFASLIAEPAAAAVEGETAFVFNTLLFLLMGFLVMWMAAGFAMLESGMVRSKNVATICLKNIVLYSLAGITFYLVGYNLMYTVDTGGYLGTISIWSADDTAFLAETPDFGEGDTYASKSDWFFQMVFVATAASIVSGTVAERIKLWSFLAFVIILTAIIYPIQGSWQWGGGWLAEAGFSDFAGSTLVHSVGGWAALVGAIFLGARKGRFSADGTSTPMPGSSMALATLGTFVLWLGWFGFNGGSQLALGSASNAIDISAIFVNTNMAAAGGVVAAMVFTQLVFGKVDLTIVLNGAIGGLVSITAEPLTPSISMSILIGAIGGLLIPISVMVLDKLKIDDVVGAIPAHLVCGIWGTMAVPLTNSGTSFGSQLLGVVSIGAFVIVTSTIAWAVLKYTIGIRVSDEDETVGLDKTELGMEAYPEFTRS